MNIGELVGLPEMTWLMLGLVLLAAFAAGWVDSVVGGGGLLQLPALLLIPGITPVQALATNKLGSIFGTATSAITYQRRVKPDLRTAMVMALVALASAIGGAAVATILPPTIFKPIIVVVLLVVAIVTLVRPQLGQATVLRFAGAKHFIVAGIIAAVIGFYDGALGPGTGTFLVMSLVSILGYDFLHASAKAKIVNFATNAGALILFIPHGSVLWLLGGMLAVLNMAGAYLGSRMAISRGTRFIRIVFLVVVFALLTKLAIDVWNENILPLIAG